MSSSLFTPLLSIVPTRRRRFFWAAWWTAPPEQSPFRKPDASSGGARTPEEAREAAERAAGQPLVAGDPRWAGAWVRVLRGDPPWPKPRDPVDADRRGEHASPPSRPPAGSRPWAFGLLGVTRDASAPEVKRAFRALALRTHPDRGGEEAAFIDAKRALEIALAATEGKPRRKRPH
jgi:hypothetical protein